MNSVSQLKEYHDKHPIGDPPAYTYQSELTSGFRATCSYRNKATFGLGGSKRDSQREAAQKMLLILGAPITETVRPTGPSKPNNVSTMPVKTTNFLSSKALTEEEKQKALRFLAEYEDKTGSSDASRPMSRDHRIIDDVNLGLKGDEAPKSDFLVSGAQYSDAIDAFKQIMKEMKLKFCCKVPNIKPDVKSEHIHIVLVQIYHQLYLMAGGTGSSVESATYTACGKAIAMLKVYSH